MIQTGLQRWITEEGDQMLGREGLGMEGLMAPPLPAADRTLFNESHSPMSTTCLGRRGYSK